MFKAKFAALAGLSSERPKDPLKLAFAAWDNRTTWPRQRVQQLVESRYGQISWTERL